MDAISKYGIIAIIPASRYQAEADERHGACVASSMYANSRLWLATVRKVDVVAMKSGCQKRRRPSSVCQSIRGVLDKELSVRYVQQREQKSKKKKKTKIGI